MFYEVDQTRLSPVICSSERMNDYPFNKPERCSCGDRGRPARSGPRIGALREFRE